MAIANKIVDTRRLAAKGRFGDTKIRNVRGKPSHVNAYEAYLMDTVGINPPASGKTINPKTRLPEYHKSSWVHNRAHDLGTAHPFEQTGLELVTNIYGAVTGADPIRNIESGANLYENITDKPAVIGDTDLTNLGGEITDFAKDEKRWTSPEDFAIERQSQDILTGGMENLQTQYEQYMGDEGFIEREQDIREKGLKSTYDIAMGGYDLAGKKLSESTGASYKQLGDVSNVQRSRSNLAYSGTIEQKVEEGKRAIGKQYDLGREGIKLGRTGTQSTYDIGMDASALGAEKSEADFMGGLRKQMNIMMTDYLSATGEAYGDTGAGSMWEELNTLFDTYSENV